MTQVTTLTAAQIAAHNKAVDLYTLRQMKLYGGLKAKPVILLPRFEEDADTEEFIPVESNGVRHTKKEGFSFLRFAMPVVSISNNGTPEVKVLKTNVFNDDTKLELLVEAHDLRIGSLLPEAVLVIEESLTPFNRKNPEQDLKYAGQDSGIACTFTGEYQGVTYDSPAPIYRRVKLADAGTTNILITHTNKDEISKYAQTAWAAMNAPAIKTVKAGKAVKA